MKNNPKNNLATIIHQISTKPSLMGNFPCCCCSSCSAATLPTTNENSNNEINKNTDK
jgi:hypothetical protein